MEGEKGVRGMEKEEEDRVLRQLKKTQVNITIWGLLISSKNHRQAILDALSRFDVPTGISPEELVALVTTSSGKSKITFSDEDLPPEGSNHNKPLAQVFKN